MQLNKKNIENKKIFLDTSIFESENYFEGKNINILFSLAKEELIQLKITDIVYREIQNRINNHAIKAVNLFKKQKLNFDKEARILRNTNVLETSFNKVDFKKLKEEAKQKIKGKFDTVIKDYNIEILDSSDTSVKEVLDDYFAINPPFKIGQKKSEFPDALSVNAIKNWCEKNSKTVIHLSNDKDFEEYKSEFINCSHNLTSLLESIFTKNSGLQFELITAIYEKSINEIIVSVEHQIQIPEDLSSLAFSTIENDAWYEDVETDFLEIDKTEIVIGVINEINDDLFSYEIEMNIFFSVDVYYNDLTTAIYDKEDGIWWGAQRVNDTKEFCANTIIYADFELEENKIDGYFNEISSYDIRSVEEI